MSEFWIDVWIDSMQAWRHMNSFWELDIYERQEYEGQPK